MQTILLAAEDRLDIGFLARLAEHRTPMAQVEAAHDGYTAIDWLHQHSCTLAVVAQELPGLSGLEVIRRVRRSNIPTPIVLLCEQANRTLALRARASGAQEVLVKPLIRPGVEAVLSWFVPAPDGPPGAITPGNTA